MKILVTGAAGMLGSALCPTLTQKKHEVLSLMFRRKYADADKNLASRSRRILRY